MPFTFSHPSILIPLFYISNKWISITGLIIGSLIPDFEYFIRMQIISKYSHSIDGVFWFDLPLCLILAYVFHNIVRNLLINNLPRPLFQIFSNYNSFNWNQYLTKNWFIVIISILIGAFSHIFWDSFTHNNGFFVQRYKILSNTVTILHLDIPIYKVLQHSSTIVGAIFIAYFTFKLPKSKTTKRNINSNYWLLFIFISLLIIFARIYFGLNPKQYGNLIVTAISASLISLIIIPFLLRKNKNTNTL